MKLIAMRCAGYDRVDVKAARELGIRVVRVPTYSPTSVAEHAVALLLALNRCNSFVDYSRDGQDDVDKDCDFVKIVERLGFYDGVIHGVDG